MRPRSIFATSEIVGVGQQSQKTDGSGPMLIPLPKPRGLRSDWRDAVWHFETVKATGLHSIRWDRRLPDGSKLTDKKHSHLLETGRRFLTILIEDPADCFSIDGHETAIHRTITLLSIMEWVVGLGYKAISEVTRNDWLTFRDKLPLGLRYAKGTGAPRKVKLTALRLLEIYRVCQALHLFQVRTNGDPLLLEDGLIFPPFEQGEDPLALACNAGQRGGKTPNIPPPIALHCLDAAIQYIAYYSDDLIKLQAESVRLQGEAKSGRPRRTPGGLVHEVKSAILSHLRGNQSLQLTAGGYVVRSALARQLNTHPSLLSGKEISQLLQELERSLAQRDREPRDRLRLRLASEVDKWRSPPREAKSRDIATKLGLPFSGKPGSAAPWPIEAVGSSRRGGNRMTLERAIANLWTAVFIVYDMFMSDRIGECLSSEIGCITKGLDGFYLRSPFYKPTNSQAGQSNARPCPAIVARAVGVAEQLGAEARARIDSNKLFAVAHRLGAAVMDEDTVRKRLSSFCEDVGAPKHDGTDWQLGPHQLRRFLPQAWVWYFELGPGLDALCQHLRHEDIKMAMHYADLGTSVTEEQRELTASVLERSVYEGLDVMGPFGKRWRRIGARIIVKAVDSDDLSGVVTEIMERKDVLLYPQPWGYCVWWRNAAAYAKCLPEELRNGIRSRPDTRKHAETCAGCINNLLTEIFAPFWIEARARHYAILSRDRVPPALAEAARLGVQISERVCRELNV